MKQILAVIAIAAYGLLAQMVTAWTTLPESVTLPEQQTIARFDYMVKRDSSRLLVAESDLQCFEDELRQMEQGLQQK